MCHDALEVKLNKKVNFIVGANGSGKSAILTALTVGLGARANVTNRGGQIKSKLLETCLIKTLILINFYFYDRFYKNWKNFSNSGNINF